MRAASPENFAMSIGPESCRIEPAPRTSRPTVTKVVSVCLTFSSHEAASAASGASLRRIISVRGPKPIFQDPPSARGTMESVTRPPPRSTTNSIGDGPFSVKEAEAARTFRTTS